MARGRRTTDWDDPRELDNLERRVSELETAFEALEDLDQSGVVDEKDAELRGLLLGLLQKANSNQPAPPVIVK